MFGVCKDLGISHLFLGITDTFLVHKTASNLFYDVDFNISYNEILSTPDLDLKVFTPLIWFSKVTWALFLGKFKKHVFGK